MDANALRIPVSLDPAIDAQRFATVLNVFLSRLKESLGAFGPGIKLIDGDSLTEELEQAKEELRQINEQAGNIGKSGGGFAKAFQFNQIHDAVQTVIGDLKELVGPVTDYQQGLADMSAITGIIGPDLDELGDKAVEMALKFGGKVNTQIEASKGTLSRFGADLAKAPADFAVVMNNINTLGAAGDLKAADSMDALTTAMLQYNVNTQNTGELASESTRFINVMAASARVGAAEINQVGESLRVAGAQLSGANVSVEEANATIQVLAAGGKVGSEAGVAARNIVGLLQKQAAEGDKALAKMGLSTQKLGELLTTKGLNAALSALNDGLAGYNSAAERNAVMMQLFGTENASAASVLLKSSEITENGKSKLQDWTEQMTGTNDAVTQAAIRMDTGKAAGERFTAWIEATAIKGFGSLGSGFTSVLEGATKMAPALSTITSLKGILPDGLISNLANFGKQILSSVVPGLFAQTTATGGATAATGVLNATMLLNPALLIAAGIAALVAAFVIFSDHTKSLKDATADSAAAVEDFNNATAATEGIAKQEQHINQLVQKHAELKDATDPEKQKEFTATAEELAAIVPDAAEAVDVLNSKGEKIATTYNINTEAIKRFNDEQRQMAAQQRDEAAANLQDQTNGLADSLHAALEKQEALRESRKKLNDTVAEGKGDDSIGGALSGAPKFGEILKDVNGELRTQQKEIAAAEPEIRKVIAAYREQGLSIDEIARVTGFAGNEVTKYGGLINESAVSAKQLETAIATLPKAPPLFGDDTQAKNIRLVADQAGQYKMLQGEVDKLNEKIAHGKAVGIDTKDLEKSLSDAQRKADEKKIQLQNTIDKAGGEHLFDGLNESAKRQLAGLTPVVDEQLSEMKRKATEADLGKAIGESAKIKQNLDEADNIGKLVDKLKNAKTEAEKADISAAIAAQVPSAISGYDQVTGATIIATDKVKAYVDAQKQQGNADILTKQAAFTTGMKAQADQLSQNRDRMAQLQQKIVESAQKGEDVTQLTGQYESLKKTVQGNTDELAKTITQGKKVGLIKGDVHDLGTEFTLSAKQAQSIGVAVKQLDSDVKSAAQSVADLAKSFDDSQKAASSGFKTDVSALVTLRREATALAKDTSLSDADRAQKLKENAEQQSKVTTEGRANFKQTIQDAKDVESAEIALGKVKEKNHTAEKKHHDSLFDKLWKQYELKKKMIELDEKQSTIAADILRLQQGRERNIFDEIAAEQLHRKSLEQTQEALDKTFHLVRDARGISVGVGVRLNKEQAEQVFVQARELSTALQASIIQETAKRLPSLSNDLRAGLEGLSAGAFGKPGSGKGGLSVRIAGLNKDDIVKVKDEANNLGVQLSESDVKALEFDMKLKFDQQHIDDEVAKINKDRLQFEIELGFKPKSDLTALLAADLAAVQKQKVDLENELKGLEGVTGKDDVANTLILAHRYDLEAKLRAANAKLLESEKSVWEDRRRIQEEEMKQLEKDQQRQTEIVQKLIDAQKRMNEILVAGQSQLLKDKARRDADDELKELEDRRKRKLIGEQKYEQEKKRIADEATAKQQAAESLARGEQLRAEAEQQRDLLQLQLQQLLAKKAVADEHGDTALSASLQEQMDKTQLLIKEKGDELTDGVAIVGEGLSKTMSTWFAGDSDGTRKNLRETLGTLAGYLKKLLTAAITDVVLQSAPIKALAALSGFAAPLVIAGATGAVSLGLSALFNPLISSLLSFGSGGIVTRPTLAVVGDRNPARSDDQTEMILGSDQLHRILMLSHAMASAPTVAALGRIEELLLSQRVVGVFTGRDLQLLMKSAVDAEAARERP